MPCGKLPEEYSQNVFRLAETFVQNAHVIGALGENEISPEELTQVTHDLALEIQGCIEDWLVTQKEVKIRTR